MVREIIELYNYRTLLKALTVRHLAVRYRGSFLGFLWSFLNPLCLMLVYTLVFKFYIRFDNVDNYTIFLFCGLLPWLWISSGLLESTTSVISSGHLITKSMFPAHILPAVAVVTSMVNFILSLPLLFIFMAFAGMSFHWTLVLLPVVILMQALFLLGAGLALSALNVQFRDVQHIVGNLLTFLFFLCPILYPITQVPERFHFTMDYNPLAQMTIFFQKIILDGVIPSLWEWGFLSIFVLLSMVFGSLIFRKYRESFAELL